MAKYPNFSTAFRGNQQFRIYTK